VYIGSINTCHFENCKEAINAGKHVVCEKPLVLNSEEAVVLFDMAKEKNVFLMEAMWSRFMPIYVKLKDMLETGKLGKIHSASANFTTKMDSLPRIFNKNMGGGGMYDLGVYTLQFCLLAFNDEYPDEISTCGSLDPVSGVDNTVSTSLVYRGRGFANSFCNTLGETNRDAFIIGSEGSIKLVGPFHSPVKMEVFDKNGEITETVEHVVPKSENSKSEFIFGNSGNLIYEADHALDCVLSGKLESDVWSRGHTLRSLKIIETCLGELGYYSDN